jgi:hypothetical protein
LVTGSHIYEGLDPLSTAYLNMTTWLTQQRSHQDPTIPISAANMLFHLRDPETLEQLIELPHIWLLEDQAMRDVVVDNNGELASTVHRNARVVTDASDRHRGLFANLNIDWRRVFSLSPVDQDSVSSFVISYLEDAAPGSITYDQFKSEERRLLLGLKPTV